MPRFVSRRNNVPIMHMCDSEIKLTFWLICMQQEKQHTMCKYTFGVGFTTLPAVVVNPIVLWVKLESNNKCQVYQNGQFDTYNMWPPRHSLSYCYDHMRRIMTSVTVVSMWRGITYSLLIGRLLLTVDNWWSQITKLVWGAYVQSSDHDKSLGCPVSGCQPDIPCSHQICQQRKLGCCRHRTLVNSI